MRVTPTVIDFASVTASSVAEPATGEAVWSSGATYDTGDQVIDTTHHRTYSSLTDDNSANPPPVWPEIVNDHWADIGPTQKYAAFDLSDRTATTSPSPYSFTIAPGERVNTFGAKGVVADSVTIEFKVGGETRQTETIQLRSRNTVGWYSYYFGAFSWLPSFVRHNLPPNKDAEIVVTFTRASGPVIVTFAALGSYVDLGEVEVNPDSDRRNFSDVTRDTDGKARMNKRKSIPQTRQDVVAPAARNNVLQDAREQLDAVPAFWTGLSDPLNPHFDSLTVVGFHTRWNMTLDHNLIRQQIELEGI